jgi:hypothetical protein
MKTPLLSVAAIVASTIVAGFSVELGSAPSRAQASAEKAESARVRTTSQTLSVYFPDVRLPPNVGIGLVRVVVTCGHVAAITKIPDDWYVQTMRPSSQSGLGWSEFKLAWSAVEFAAGHGVSRLSVLRSLDGAIRVAVDDTSCFDVTADLEDAMGSDWKTRLRRADLRLRK